MKKMLALFTTFVLLAGMPAAPAALAEAEASASTFVDDASNAQLNNIELAAQALDGAYIPYGETFSFNETVGERSEDNGYGVAVNGRGVRVVGGGVAQVATTLYLALKQLDGIEYVDKVTYGSRFTGGYVDSGSNAIATDYDDDIDFSFVNYYGDFYINMLVSDDTLECSLSSYEDSGFGDVAGSASIYLDGTDAQIHNIELASESIYDTVLESGDVFSFNTIVGPRTDRYGYESAVNGRGVRVVGGGVAQVASAIWLAVKDLDNVTILDRSTYGSRYNQSYVDSADDAVMTDYNSDIDFSFEYNGDGELSIYTFISGDSLKCEVYESDGDSW